MNYVISKTADSTFDTESRSDVPRRLPETSVAEIGDSITIAWGDRIKVQQTPTVLLDGNIKVEQIDPDNLKVIIQSILDADGKR